MTDARDWQSNGTTQGVGSPRRSVERGEAAADPTDPEVPDAKRRSDVRRRRSMIVAAAAVVGLVVIVLLLLYRMGRQVTNAETMTQRDDISAPAAASSAGGAVAPIIVPVAPAPALGAPPRAIAPASSDRPQLRAKPRAAPDIFRKPAF